MAVEKKIKFYRTKNNIFSNFSSHIRIKILIHHKFLIIIILYSKSNNFEFSTNKFGDLKFLDNMYSILQ